jgi:hypothetical protein
MPAEPKPVTLMVVERITDRSSLAKGKALDGIREAKPEEVWASPVVLRLLDLVRFSRGYLHDAEAISDEEYVALVEVGAQSARRLESYDEMKAERASYEGALDDIRAMCEAAGISGETWEPDPDDHEDPSPIRTWHSTPRVVERLVKTRDAVLDGQDRAFCAQVEALTADRDRRQLVLDAVAPLLEEAAALADRVEQATPGKWMAARPRDLRRRLDAMGVRLATMKAADRSAAGDGEPDTTERKD